MCSSGRLQHARSSSDSLSNPTYIGIDWDTTVSTGGGQEMTAMMLVLINLVVMTLTSLQPFLCYHL